MRIFIAILIVLVSVSAQAQARTKTGKSASAAKFPLHSTLYFVPESKVSIIGTAGVAFASSSIETFPGGGVTATDEIETNAMITQLNASYGIMPQLALGIEFGYGTSTQKNTSYRDSAGTFGVALEADVKNKGLLDPEVYAAYRPIESDLVVDLVGSLRLGFLSSEIGTSGDSGDVDTRDDLASDGNLASGSYGLALKTRAGYKLSERLNLIGELKGEYNFASTQTVKSPVIGDLQLEGDANTEFSGRADVEFFLTPQFIVTPFAALIMNPKAKSHTLSGGVTTNIETDAFKTYRVGLVGSYLIQSGLALKAGYAYSSFESAKLQTSTGGAAFVVSNNTKDREAHTLTANIAYEF